MTQTPMEVMSTFTKVVPAYDNDGLRAILHEDVVVHEAPTLPYGGDHRGKDAFIRLFEWVNELWGFTETFNYTVYDSGPETVIVLVEVDSYAKKTGSPLLIRVLEIFTIREGLIVDLDVYYFDTGAMCDALGEKREIGSAT